LAETTIALAVAAKNTRLATAEAFNVSFLKFNV
jgi:hypothetical protein